jgi:hypothetical protein
LKIGNKTLGVRFVDELERTVTKPYSTIPIWSHYRLLANQIHATCSGKRRLLESNLENALLVWADSAQNYL